MMSKFEGKSAVIVMYTHVEGYPPSLNAIQQLSTLFDKLIIVHRNTMKNTWVFPENVKLETFGEFTSSQDVKNKSWLWKLASFIRFGMLLWKTVRKNRPDWILIHEPIALLAWGIIRKIYTPKHFLWYHNHDVIKGHESFFFRDAFRMQNAIFDKIDIFSLPADERKIHFPMKKFKGKYFHIPNYPGIYLYDRYYKPREMEKNIRVVFQGHIGHGHCLEEMVHLLHDDTLPVQLRLVLKGFKDEDFLNKLLALAKSLEVQDKVIYHGVSSYQSVPEVASMCHIGIGIHTKTDIMNSTLGKASNKIYEYAALGLPVLLFDSPHFKEHLGQYPWAIFTDGTMGNLKKSILDITSNYAEKSISARQDFLRELNFEKCFQPVLDYVTELNINR
jgi:glycosyltransferase involved in cell wall biosynthesis